MFGFTVSYLQHVGSSSLIREQIRPALGVWGPSHWATREAPVKTLIATF